VRDNPAAALFCLNPATGVFSIRSMGTVIGGSGKFAGATGAYEVKGAGNILLSDPAGRLFAAFTFQTEATISTPHGD